MIFPIALQFKKEKQFTDDDFFEFCQQNRDLKLEKDENGQIIVGMPTSTKTGNLNAKLTIKVGVWAEKTNSGEVFDSSTGFTLKSGAVRSPDVAWVSKTRWEALSEEEKEKFAPICPDFLIELMSESDSLVEMKKKMLAYIESGCRLAWLIDLKEMQIFVYRANGEIQIIKDFKAKLSGEDVLQGFELDLNVLGFGD